jgi:hypothetical protein
MKHSTKLLGFGAALAGTLAFVGCGSSDNAGTLHSGGSGGAVTAGAGGAQIGNGGANTSGNNGLAGAAASGGAMALGGGTSGGTGGLEQTAGTAGLPGGADSGGAGGGAGTSGSAGASAGSAGTGGAPIPINPAIVLLDTILLRPKASTGAGGAGGGAGAGGASGSAGTGGTSGSAGAGGVSGSAGMGGTSGSAGGGGAPSVVDHSRSYTFDADPQMWALHPEGSTPNIGTAGGAEKLSAQTVLSWNKTDGVPTLGAVQLNIPFSHTGEQLDVNQFFAAAGASAEEDWTGYELVAKVKLALGGDLGTCLGAWEYATSDGFIFARSPEVLLKAANGWVDMRFDLDAPDSGAGQTVIPPSTAGFDKTKVNQFGIMVESYHCP